MNMCITYIHIYSQTPMTANITGGFDRDLETCSRPNKEQLNTPRTRNGIMEVVRW